MKINQRLESLLVKLAHTTAKNPNASHIDPANVRRIIESGEHIIAPQYATMPGIPRKLVTIQHGDGAHEVQIEATSIHPHVFCITCDGYCDYAAAALLLVIVDGEGHRHSKSCPECGQAIPFNGEPVQVQAVETEQNYYGLEARF